MIYLLCNETIDSGVVQTQILNNLSPDDTIIEICRVDFLFRNSYALETFPFRFIRVPILLLNQRGFSVFPFLLYLNWLLALPALFFLRFFVLKEKVVTLRGYMSGSLAFFLNSRTLIWDPRSLFFHEQRHNNQMTNYFERLIVRNVRKILVVSNGMKNYFNEFNEVAEIQIEPCSPAHRSNQEISYGRKGLVYYGSLDSKWNNKFLYLDFFLKLRKACPHFEITIISQNADEIKNDWPDLGINFYCNPSTDTLRKLLVSAKFGIFLYPNYADAFTRYGVKYATYKEFNLITIASKNLLSVFEDGGDKVISTEAFIDNLA